MPELGSNVFVSIWIVVDFPAPLADELGLTRRQINYALARFNEELTLQKLPTIQRNPRGDIFVPLEVVQLFSHAEVKEQRKIKIKAKTNPLKLLLALFLAGMILFIFWPKGLANQVKLSIFALLVASYGLLSEGLTEEQVIKLGVFSGKFQDYQQIQVEKITEKESFVTFYQKKNHSFSLRFAVSAEEVTSFLEGKSKFGIID